MPGCYGLVAVLAFFEASSSPDTPLPAPDQPVYTSSGS
jgi:hypothetical protein